MSPSALPIYALIGTLPVRAKETEDGGILVEAFNRKTKKFETEPKYLGPLLFGMEDPGEDVSDLEILTAEEFAKEIR